MIGISREGLAGRFVVVVVLGSALLLGVGLKTARAQALETRLPGTQAPTSDSLEAQIFDQLSGTGQYTADDLPRLARLAVLESIAMGVEVRADLRNSVMGISLDAESTAMWDAAQAFYESVSESQLDMTTLSRAQELFGQVIAAQRQLDSSLGELPGLSLRAATHLQSLSRLVGASSSAMSMLEADLARTAPVQVVRTLDLGAMRRQSQLLANDLVSLIEKVGEYDRGTKKRGPVQGDLSRMLSLVQDFQRRISQVPSSRELQESYRAVRRRMWQVEAEIARMDWPAALRGQWRAVRDRANGISDDFGLPRVIEGAPGLRPAASSNRKLAAQVDRAVAWVDEFLTVVGPELRKTPAGAQFQVDTSRMRSQLLQLRRSVIANEPPERLSPLIREIEASNQKLLKHAGEVALNVNRVDMIARFRNPALAVNNLRGLVAGQ
jgi:hypothetical protein